MADLLENDVLRLGLAVFATLWFASKVLAPRRDRRRFFTRNDRKAIMRRAGGRCEHAGLFGRCRRWGRHADHVKPWSRGGRTVVANGAWLCAWHNLRKGARRTGPVYRWRLERRRLRYR